MWGLGFAAGVKAESARHTLASSDVLRSFLAAPSPLEWRLCWRGPSAATTAFNQNLLSLGLFACDVTIC